MRHITYSFFAFFGALTLLASPAHAGFKYTPSTTVASSFAPVAAPAPVMALPAGDASASTRTGMVEGFADKVPLTVALRQVLPKGVMFTVADNVDVATLVSWQGGRQWQVVLDDMLGNAGLKATYNQNAVWVEKAAPLASNYPAAAPEAPITLHEPTEYNRPAPTQVLVPPAEPVLAPAPAPMVADSAPIVMVPPAAEPPPAPAGKLTARELTAMELDRIDRTSQPMGQSQAAPQPMDTPMPTAGMLLPPAGAEAQPMVGLMQDNPMPPAAAMPTSWEAKAGQTLHEVMEAWAQRAGIELNWLSEYDYPIQASMTFNGDFETAVRTLLTGFASASPQPVGRLHRNEQLGQLSLVIEMRGNLYNE